MSCAGYFFPKIYFFTKLQGLNPSLGYFANSSIIKGVKYNDELYFVHCDKISCLNLKKLLKNLKL